jgi:membrane associated rhomboid family serine protease
MFPLRDDNPTLSTSFATYAIIALNVLAWIFIQGMGKDPALSRSVCQLGTIPGELLGTIAPGTRVPIGPHAACVVGSGPSWITPLTSMFMHGSWGHIIGNMWFLAVFGDNVEGSMGRLRFVVFYLLCGLVAVATQVMANTTSAVPMVGASGAIGGVMGAYAVLYPRVRVHLLVFLGFYIDRIVVPAYVMLGYWFLLQLVLGIPALGGEGGGVAFWAHTGGFLAGIALSFAFRDAKRVAAHRRAIATRWGARYV